MGERAGSPRNNSDGANPEGIIFDPVGNGPDHDSSIATPVASLTAPSPQPATLGMLALGAPTLSI